MNKNSLALIALTLCSASASALTTSQTNSFTGLSNTASDTTSNSTFVTSSTSTPLSFSQFNADTGVLTGVSSTLNISSGTLSLSSSGGKPVNGNSTFGSTGSISATSNLSGLPTFSAINDTLTNRCLGGSDAKCFPTNSTTPIDKLSDTTWTSGTATANAGNLNTYVGTSSLASNLTVTNSVSLTSRSSITNPIATLSAENLEGSQSLTYSYLNHANASFASAIDTNSWAQDVSSGAFNFLVYNLGSAANTAKLDSLSFSCISGNCGNFLLTTQSFTGLAAGGSSNYGSISLSNTATAGQVNNAVFGLTFKDFNEGGAFASNTLKENSLLLTVSGSVSPVPEPETYAMLLAGLSIIGLKLRRRKAVA